LVLFAVIDGVDTVPVGVPAETVDTVPDMFTPCICPFYEYTAPSELLSITSDGNWIVIVFEYVEVGSLIYAVYVLALGVSLYIADGSLRNFPSILEIILFAIYIFGFLFFILLYSRINSGTCFTGYRIWMTM